jgi:hypothetical protein
MRLEPSFNTSGSGLRHMVPRSITVAEMLEGILPIRRQTKLGLIRKTMGLASWVILPGVAKWA